MRHLGQFQGVVLVSPYVEDDEDVAFGKIQQIMRPGVRRRLNVRHAGTHHLKVQEQVFRQRMRDPSTHDVKRVPGIGDKRAGPVEFIRVDLRKRVADVVDHSAGKPVQNMAG